MTRGSSVRSALLLATVALVAASIIVSSAAIMLSIAGYKLEATTVFLSIITIAGLIILFRNLIARLLITLLLRGKDRYLATSEEAYDTGFDFETARKQIEDTLEEIQKATRDYTVDYKATWFLLMNLINRIKQKIAPWIENVIVVVHEGGFIYEVYPERDIEFLDGEELNEDILDNIEVITKGKTMEIWIDMNTAHTLATEVMLDQMKKEKDMGDYIELKSTTTLSIIYKIAKKMYESLNPTAPEELAAYTAYKVLRNLQKEGILKISQKINNIQLERKEIWTKIKRQIQEEEISTRGNNPNN